MLSELKEELIQKLNNYFPSLKFEVNERRGIVLELRAILDDDTFIEIYANAVTEKRSYTLISKGKRITGYDNYKFWHYHPLDNPDSHLQCVEPSIDFIFTKFKEAVKEVNAGKA